MPFQIIEASIDDVQSAYKAGTLTAHQLVQAYLARIDAYDKNGPKINSIITVNPHALEEADKLDAAYKASGPVGPLHGIPIVVKDEIDAAGMPTTLGTLVFKDYRPPRDAFVVEKLRKAGAIILGKTTLSEYAAGDTYGSMFGATRNPYDLERTIGGSSGGSGGALAANLCDAWLSARRRSRRSVGPATFNAIRCRCGRRPAWSAAPACGTVIRLYTRRWGRWRAPSAISRNSWTAWPAMTRKTR